MSEKPAIFALQAHNLFRKMKTDKRIVINGDVKLDTVTVYSENQIKVDACPWTTQADDIVPDGTVKLKGCTTIEPGAHLVFRPYRIGSQGSRYKQLFKTEHCMVMQTQGGLIIEKWQFKPTMNATNIRKVRLEEGKKINAYYQSRKEETIW